MGGERRGFLNRIVGHGEVEPDQLLANPGNFRRHPPAQRDALRGSLRELGWLKEVLVNKRSGHLLDGHARVEEALARGAKVPVTYLDLSEEEEQLALASLDAMTAMATVDDEALASLLAEVETRDQGLRAMLLEMEAGEPVEPVEVREVEVSEVEDRFWMSVRGPLPKQLEALERLRAALRELGPDVEVDVGTTDG